MTSGEPAVPVITVFWVLVDKAFHLDLGQASGWSWVLSSHLCRHLFREEGPGRQKPGVAQPSLPPLHFLVITERHMVLSSKSAGLGSARPLPPCSSALFNVVHLQVSNGTERGQVA